MPFRTTLPFILLLAGACGIGTSNTYPATAPVRTLANLPAEFVAADSTANAADSFETGCRSPLVDPHDRTRLILKSSQGGQVGDYEVPPDRYGVGPSEYLRVDCRTRRPLGAVPRRG